MLVLKTFQKIEGSLMLWLATETGLRPFNQHSKHVQKPEPCPTCAVTMLSMECLPVLIESCWLISYVIPGNLMDLWCPTVEQLAMSIIATILPDQTQRRLSFVWKPAVIGTVVWTCVVWNIESGSILTVDFFLMHAGSEYHYLLTSVQEGRMSEEELSVSVTRLMKAFIMLGALDPPEMVPYSK